jgi:isocitrate lyase
VSDSGDQAACLRREWETSPRWTGILRDYSAEDVIRLRGSSMEDHAPARRGVRRLWEMLGREDAVHTIGAIIGHPLPRTDPSVAPTVAVAPAAFGPEPDAFELMKTTIEAGAAGVYSEDRLSSPSGSSHAGRSVLIPAGEHIQKLSAVRLAADVLNVPTLVISRTHAHETSLLTSDADERDHEFLTGERTTDGLHLVQPGPYFRVTRALAFAPYADVLWLEAATPNLAEARAFANIIYSQYPGKLLAYSCSPAFDWSQRGDAPIARFQDALAALGYRLQSLPTPNRLPGVIKPGTETTPPAGSKEKAQFAVSGV